MPPMRRLLDGTPGEVPSHEDVQQLVEAEQGMGTQGIWREWLAADSNKVVLVSDEDGVKISEDNGTTAPSAVLVASMLDEIIPPGTIWPYAGPVIPVGWLLCNGVAVSRATYARLFVAIGDYWGAGNGTTTFNLPDLVGRVPLGASAGHPLAQRSGSELGPAHTHGLAGHTHASTAHAHSLNGHTHTTNLAHEHTASAGGPLGTVHRVVVGTGTDPNHPNDAHTHAVTVIGVGTTATPVAASATADTGSATPAATGGPSGAGLTDAAGYASTVNLPPFGAVQFIIRAGT
jgi:microcystin-dependent protein